MIYYYGIKIWRPADFKTAYKKIQHRIPKTEEFLKNIGVRVLYPFPSPQLTNITRNIVEYASILLDAFPKLESNDAMHLSIAEYLNIKDIMSLDDSFKDVDTITVYSLE